MDILVFRYSRKKLRKLSKYVKLFANFNKKWHSTYLTMQLKASCLCTLIIYMISRFCVVIQLVINRIRNNNVMNDRAVNSINVISVVPLYLKQKQKRLLSSARIQLFSQSIKYFFDSPKVSEIYYLVSKIRYNNAL